MRNYLQEIVNDVKLLMLDVEHFVAHASMLVVDVLALCSFLRVKANKFKAWVEGLLEKHRGLV